jgi:hypothetical protein
MRASISRSLSLSLTLLALGHGVAAAQDEAEPAAPEAKAAPEVKAAPKGKPPEVAVGVYVNRITSVDLKANEFTASFWVWFRWTGDDLKPIETFEVVGARIESKENVVEEELDGGVRYAAVRVLAHISKFYDIGRFPLDNHTLTIVIEDTDNEDHKMRFVADIENSALDAEVQVPGWKIAGSEAQVRSHGYTTNYGDTSLPTNNKSSYSRFEYSIELVRPGMGYFFKLFWGGFMATLIALMAFFIRPTDLDPRFGLGVGAIFAAIASAYVISAELPETQEMTLADLMNGLAILYIFLSLVVSTISLRLFSSGREVASRRLDQISFWTLLLTYAWGNVLVVMLAT